MPAVKYLFFESMLPILPSCAQAVREFEFSKEHRGHGRVSSSASQAKDW